MAIPRLYLHSNNSSLYFQIKFKGQRYIIYSPFYASWEIQWNQEKQCFMMNHDWAREKEFEYGELDEDFYDSEEYEDYEYEVQKLNVDVNRARLDMEEKVMYMRKTGDVRFIKQEKEKYENIKTVTRAVELYVKDKKGYDGAVYAFKKHLKTFKGAKSLNIDLESFYKHLLKFVSVSSANTVLTLVRGALAKADGNVRPTKFRKASYSKEGIVLTRQEIESILNDPTLELKYKSVVRVLYSLCLRYSEMEQLNYVEGMESIQIFQKKTNKFKTVKLEGKEDLISALKYLSENPRVNYFAFNRWLKNILSKKDYLNRILPDGKTVGDSLTTHVFRRSVATHAIESGKDIKTVSKMMLNHSDIATTMRSYYQPEEDDPFDFT
jgi:integrase